MPGFAATQKFGARGNDGRPPVCSRKRRTEGMVPEMNQNRRKEDPDANRS